LSTYIKRGFSSLLLSLLFLTTHSFASEHVEIRHELIANSPSAPDNAITLRLHITNHGFSDINQVRISPNGNEFSVDESDSRVFIGRLPSQGEAIIEWTALTPVTPEYFTSEMPVFFELTGKKQYNEPVNLSLYSRGE